MQNYALISASDLITSHPHKRLNPLTGEWVIVSPHRAERPWQGAIEKVILPIRPQYDSNCYLCPGNQRASGEVNPYYQEPYVFDNDFAALLPFTHSLSKNKHHLLTQTVVSGICRVLCFSPRHDLSLAEMPKDDIRKVIDAWTDQVQMLGQHYPWVQVFENKGAMMGCSNPHPHGQIWALEALPDIPAREDYYQDSYLKDYSRSLLVEYSSVEVQEGERLVLANSDWLVVVPFWATWPFETLLLPRRPVSRLPDLTNGEKNSLAELLKKLLVRYDNLFQTSFPYSMGWHGAPFWDRSVEHWQLHAHIYPPLLRSATVKKFMVGFEMLAQTQRDFTPEHAAQCLRACSEIHFNEIEPSK